MIIATVVSAAVAVLAWVMAHLVGYCFHLRRNDKDASAVLSSNDNAKQDQECAEAAYDEKNEMIEAVGSASR